MPRLTEIGERSQLPEAKRDVYDYLLQTRGSVSGGFAVLLNSPDLAGRVAQLGTYVRFESPLPARARELAALAAVSVLECAYEQAAHARLARELGVPEAAIEAVKSDVTPAGLPEDEALAIDCARAVLKEHRLPERSFASARDHFGDQGAVDLLATVGYYAMMASMFNALEVPPPAH